MRRAVAAVCLAVSLSVAGCGAIDRFVGGLDSSQAESAANLAGAILYDAASIAYDAGWIDDAMAAEVDESLTRAERFAHEGNFDMARVIYAQVRALLPTPAVAVAEQKRGESVDDAVEEVDK